MKNPFPMPPLVLVAIALIVACAGTGLAGDDAPLMTIDELKTMLGDPALVILDVRRGKDWTSSEFKIKGAVYLKPEAYEEWADTYPKDQKIVLYCA